MNIDKIKEAKMVAAKVWSSLVSLNMFAKCIRDKQSPNPNNKWYPFKTGADGAIIIWCGHPDQYGNDHPTKITISGDDAWRVMQSDPVLLDGFMAQYRKFLRQRYVEKMKEVKKQTKQAHSLIDAA